MARRQGNPSFHGLGKLQFWLGTLTNCWGWDLMFLLGFIPLKVGKTMPCLPRTGNGNHTTFRNGDDWGMVYGCLWHCFTHIIPVSSMIFRHWKIHWEKSHPSYPFQDCPAMDCSGGYLIIKVWVNMPLTFWDILNIANDPFYPFYLYPHLDFIIILVDFIPPLDCWFNTHEYRSYKLGYSRYPLFYSNS